MQRGTPLDLWRLYHTWMPPATSARQHLRPPTAPNRPRRAALPPSRHRKGRPAPYCGRHLGRLPYREIAPIGREPLRCAAVSRTLPATRPGPVAIRLRPGSEALGSLHGWAILFHPPPPAAPLHAPAAASLRLSRMPVRRSHQVSCAAVPSSVLGGGPIKCPGRRRSPLVPYVPSSLPPVTPGSRSRSLASACCRACQRRRRGLSIRRISRVCGDSLGLRGDTSTVVRPAQFAPTMSVKTWSPMAQVEWGWVPSCAMARLKARGNGLSRPWLCSAPGCRSSWRWCCPDPE